MCVQRMFSTCSARVPHVFRTCGTRVPHMFCMCPVPRIPRVLSMCSARAQCVLGACSSRAQRVLVACSARARRVLGVCSARARRMLSVRSLLVSGVEPEPFQLGEHLVSASGKLALLDQLLGHLQREGHKVLLFSQMTRMLDIIQDYLGYRGTQRYPRHFMALHRRLRRRYRTHTHLS